MWTNLDFLAEGLCLFGRKSTQILKPFLLILINPWKQAGMRNELVLCRQRKSEFEPAGPAIQLNQSRGTALMNPMEQAMLDSITLFWKTYKIGLIEPDFHEGSERGPLCDWRLHLTHNLQQRRPMQHPNREWGLETPVGKELGDIEFLL